MLQTLEPKVTPVAPSLGVRSYSPSYPTSSPAKTHRTQFPHDSATDYSIALLRDEARQLVEAGEVSRQQPIYVLCQFIPPREWVCVECELERCDYLLRDCIGDLLGCETWSND